jgi:hypothetical protein
MGGEALPSAPADPPKKSWRGIQTCSGSDADSKLIDTTSEEATLESFVKSKTRVTMKGVRTGPSPEYSCGPVDLEGVVTSSDKHGADFKGNIERSCRSLSGRTLIVSGFGGYDLDLRSEFGADTGSWTLSFNLTIEEPENRDAGEYSYTHITCRFELAYE